MTGLIEIYSMVAMGSYGNSEKVKEQFDKELARLSKGFSALNIDYKKGVLKTAQGLIRIQRTYKEMVAEGAGYSVFHGNAWGNRYGNRLDRTLSKTKGSTDLFN